MDLRQRKGKTEGEDAQAWEDLPKEEVIKKFQDKMHSWAEEQVREEAGRSKENLSSTEVTQKVEEKLANLFAPQKPPLPGLTHECKAAKDALEKDPYNLELIFNLGNRGWKRVGELAVPETRFLFLFQLCIASLECRKYKQALAVFMDVQEPEDAGHKFHYFETAVQVYAHNGNLQPALKAFNDGLKHCQEFQDVARFWGYTCVHLKKVGAYDAAKSSIEQRAKDDGEKQQLDAVESLCELRAGIDDVANRQTGMPRKYLMVILAVALCVITYMLYLLEHRSLKSLKLAK